MGGDGSDDDDDGAGSSGDPISGTVTGGGKGSLSPSDVAGLETEAKVCITTSQLLTSQLLTIRFITNHIIHI